MNLDEITYARVSKSDAELEGPTRIPKSWKRIPLYIDDYESYISKNGNQRLVNVYDAAKKQMVMELLLTPLTWQHINAYHVETAYVDPKYQGQGIGFALYKGLISLYDITLLSTGEHSPGARKLWMYLAQDPTIQAYGFAPYDRKIWLVQPDNKKKELKSTGTNPKVYGRGETGLILTKRNGKNDKVLKEFLKKKASKPDILGTTEFDGYYD